MRLPVCMSMMDQWGGGVVPCATACMSMMDQWGGGGGKYHVRLPVCMSMMDRGGGGGG